MEYKRRISFVITEEEFQVLVKLARNDLRDPKKQAQYILSCALRNDDQLADLQRRVERLEALHVQSNLDAT